jgi:hypothetical protein
MKYIGMHPRTKWNLDQWALQTAVRGPLYSASFYFWLGGTREQKSQLGLMKSLLYDVLKQNLKLVAILFPKRWSFLYSRMSQLGGLVTVSGN